jgi:uncharacterized membrane protein
MAAIIVFSLWAAKTKLGALLSPVPVLILMTVGLANAGLIPAKSPTYAFVTANLGSVAVVLLVLHADIRAVLRVSRPMLTAFAVGLTGSVVGLAVAWAFAAPEIRGSVTVLYSTVVTGGIVNMMAVGQSLGIFAANPALLPALLGGSVLIDVAYLALMGQIAKPGPVRALFDRRSGPLDESALRAAVREYARGAEIGGVEGLIVPLALACAISVAGVFTARALGLAGYAVVFAGAYAFLLANLAPGWLRRYASAPHLGMALLFLFLVAAMAGANLRDVSRLALSVAQFAATLYGVHLIVILLLGWLLRTPLPMLVIGSVAGIGGPSTTAAIAASYEWHGLVFPGVLCAVLGLAIGTYVGLTAAALIGP